MPEVILSEETIEQLEALRVEDESYDEIVSELVSIYQATELTLFKAGDEL